MEQVKKTDINERVARKLGWKDCGSWVDSQTDEKLSGHWKKPGTDSFYSQVSNYAGSIEAAWEIVGFVEKIKGSSFSLNGFDEQTAAWKIDNPDMEFERGKFHASIVIYSPECDKCGKWKHDYYEGFADTAPLAICLAFLKLP